MDYHDTRRHTRQSSEPLSMGSTMNNELNNERNNQTSHVAAGEERVGPPHSQLARNVSCTSDDDYNYRIGRSLTTTLNSSVASQSEGGTTIDLVALQQAWGSGGGEFFGSTIPAVNPLPHLHPSKSLGITKSVPPFGLDGAHSLLTRSATTSSTPTLKSDINGTVSSIHDAARITDWNKVLKLCETHPQYASFAGRDGWTALHHACNRRCPYPEVAEALIRAYPAALLQEEEKGWLPLHYACRFKAPKSVVRLLLNLYPDAGKASVTKRDRQGRTPLYYAVRYDAPPGVVGLLLEVDPSAVLEEDQNEESPLVLVWDCWAGKLEGKRLIQSFLPGGFPEPEDTTVEQRAVLLHKRLQSEPKLRKRWLKVNMLLKAAFGFPVEDDEDADDQSVDELHEQNVQRVWRIVHATAAVKCHISLFLLACALHPEQAKEFDNNDLRRPGNAKCVTSGAHQTALHLAASSNSGGEAGKTILLTLLSLNPDAAEEQDGINGSLPLHRMVENPQKLDWANHAGILYRFYPRAVQIYDHNGKLPLHRAAAAIKQQQQPSDEEGSVIVQLVRAYPQALFKVDKAGCLPFHYISANAHIWNDDVENVHSVNRAAIQTRAGAQFNKRLPIHLASANPKSRESLIQRLVQLHPRGVSMPDDLGKLPIHLVCELGKEWDTGGTRVIYDAFPNGIRQRETNSRGWLPLHMAAACRQTNVELLEKLVQYYPEAANVPDSDGQFALHLACNAGKSWDGGLKLLFDANASAISTPDKMQRLPFHIAAFLYCKKNANTQNSFVKPVPSVDVLKDKKTICKDAADLDILFQLLRADPTTVLSFV